MLGSVIRPPFRKRRASVRGVADGWITAECASAAGVNGPDDVSGMCWILVVACDG